jgi:hypothetical protein
VFLIVLVLSVEMMVVGEVVELVRLVITVRLFMEYVNRTSAPLIVLEKNVVQTVVVEPVVIAV